MATSVPPTRNTITDSGGRRRPFISRTPTETRRNGRSNLDASVAHTAGSRLRFSVRGEGAAAAEVFTRVFGRSDIPFSTCSTTLLPGQNCNDPGAVRRSYSGFRDAAYENGLSRILVGIHFRHAVNEGLEHGRKIGDWTAGLILQPIRRDSGGFLEAWAETPDTDR